MEKKYLPRRRRKGVDLGFEASVGGGIPVIQALREGLGGQYHPIHLWDHQRDAQLYSLADDP